ncbi:TonB-dependent receptor [Acidicapsa ligni]|uniref:TonB-dependent receptor n=1 Tax=Acidicapsa ligni TaxID=542300 RepID=UPI0021DF93C9|nr:Plug and carboxypeptidase regulatory-like domain-containing protein [Acidicapsa ligni]
MHTRIRSKSARWLFSLFTLCLLLILNTHFSYAQSDTSSVSGTITDSSGAVIANAKVTIRNDATGAERSTTLNGSGAYTITNLAPGSYTIRAEAEGFATAVRSGNRLDPNIGSRIDLVLKPGNTSATVTVEADANTLQTESAASGQLVTSEQVKTIQLNGRNPLYLSQLEPGVTRNAAISSFNFAPDFSGPTINGARANESVLTLDGAPMIRTRGNGTQIGVADVDSTSQVQILTTGYPAEYGGTSGGMIRMVPKSGASEYHGIVYEYLRNSFLNANTWGRNQSDQPALSEHPQPFRYNQFGWNLNGPVTIPHLFNTSKQKLFFLAGQEYLRYRQTVTQTGKVPTTLMRQGNFSELLSANIFYQNVVQLANPTTGTPYDGNVITPGQLSPNGLALLNAYPAPNADSSSYNWQEQAPYPQDQRKDTLVLDYVPKDAHHIRFSLLNYNYDYVNPFAGNFDRTPQRWHWPNQVGVLHYTWTISPTMVNEATFSASADHITISYDESNGLFNRTLYGIDYPYIYPATEKLVPNKIPTIDLANFTTLDGGPYPSHSGGVITTLADSVTKVMGSHTLKFGGLWERSGENNFDQISVSSTTPGSTNNQNGQFNFTDTRSGHPTSGAAVGNAALGLFDTYGEIGQKSYTLFRGNMGEIFAQDSWHATPKLLLEYGVRYSMMQPFYALWRNQSVFSQQSWDPSLAPVVNPTTGELTGGDPYNGIVIPGGGFPSSAQGHVPPDILNGQFNRLFRGFGPGYSKTTWSNIQPRIGITYHIAPLTVIRAGGGRFVQRIGISDSVQLGGNAPFQPSSTVTAGSVDNPGGVGVNALPLSLSSQAYDFPDPNAWSWNTAVEQEIPKFGTFTLSYVGRRGLHLSQIDEVNQLRPGTVQANPGVISQDALRPYRGFSAILQDTNAGSSMYHAMQVDLKRRMTNHLLFGVAYTWSKSMDFGSSPGYELPNYYDRNPNYGPSDFDIRNVLVINYVWDITYGNHLDNRMLRSAVGNWQLSGTTQAQTGEPFSVGTGDDFAGVGPGAGTQLWDMTRTPHVSKKFTENGNGAAWFDPTAFAQPAPGTLAPRGTRNEIYGPGFQSWSIAMLKNFHVIPGHDNHVVAFKAEAFNFTNHPNLDTPDTNPTSGTFGQVTQKGNTYSSERQIQFSLRYEF